ncbi:MAG: tetratricopeptide repeat protein, partial [Deltaproteobacteria bacterium]|nr:tetratricopeptide repeat protein [Kofleriaceae bacterium]
AAPAAKAAPLSRETRAAYKQHLSAGRKAAKAARWSEAITALEAALVAIPGDDRALGELSWAAFSAGDFAKARTSGKASVLGSTDPKVKAASLYNLGRVEEADGKLPAAANLYRQSLALRDSKIVKARLDALGKDAPLADEPLPCTTPMPEAELCACLNATTARYLDKPEDAACKLSAAGADGFEIATYTVSSMEEQHALVAQQAGGWTVVALLAHVYNPGMMGINEEWSLADPVEATIGGHQVVRFTYKKSRSDTDMGIDEVEDEETESLVVCVRGSGRTPTTCPIDVIVSYTYVRDRLGVADDEEMTDVADLRTKGLPIRSERKVSVEIGADGVAKLRAVAGQTDASVLGDKKLW